MNTIKKLVILLIVLGDSFSAQSHWTFKPNGITFYGDLLSFSNTLNYSESDPRTGNFSFGAQYYFRINASNFYLSPGINLSFIRINGIPNTGTDFSKPFPSIPSQSEILLPIIYPIAFDWKFNPLFSAFINTGISVGGKYHLDSQKSGSVLNGDKINLFSINAGLKTNITSNLSGYLSLKYYFGDKYKFQDYYDNYNVNISKISVYNVGIGISYNLFNWTTGQKEIFQFNNKIDSLNAIIAQKNLTLEELKKSLDISQNELDSTKNLLRIIKDSTSVNKSLVKKNNLVIIDIDSLNNEYNAKFYTDLSIDEFLAGNNQNLSDDGKALLEGYYDVANKIEIDQKKGISLTLLVPDTYKQIFQDYINEMNWINILSIRDDNNSKYVRFEIDKEKFKKNYNIDLEIEY